MSLCFLTSSAWPAATGVQPLWGAVVGVSAAATPGWPVQQVATPVLGDARALFEIWAEDGGRPVASGSSDGVAWRRAGDVLLGVVEIDDAAIAPADGRTPLRAAAHDAYARIFRLLDAQGLPHLWRLWNYMAHINGESHGMERYRQFNMGRGDAFEADSRSVVGRVPAACALGVAGGPLSIAFMAGSTPIVPVENPRQVSAFLYPDRYGPRSPTFSRAALVYPPGQEILFVSGTASIVGHETVHPGDVRAQTAESLDNIAAVLGEASARGRTGPYGLSELCYRAYVRHAPDLDAVRSVVAARVGEAPVTYVQADVCRSDLLVEVEGHCIR